MRPKDQGFSFQDPYHVDKFLAEVVSDLAGIRYSGQTLILMKKIWDFSKKN